MWHSQESWSAMARASLCYSTVDGTVLSESTVVSSSEPPSRSPPPGARNLASPRKKLEEEYLASSRAVFNIPPPPSEGPPTPPGKNAEQPRPARPPPPPPNSSIKDCLLWPPPGWEQSNSQAPTHSPAGPTMINGMLYAAPPEQPVPNRGSCPESLNERERLLLREKIEYLASKLRGFPNMYAQVNVITEAKIPLVSCVDLITKKKIDITINNQLAVRNTALLKKYASAKLCKNLVLLVKKWAHHVGVAGSVNGYPSSYAWALMVVYYLQNCYHREGENTKTASPEAKSIGGDAGGVKMGPQFTPELPCLQEQPEGTPRIFIGIFRGIWRMWFLRVFNLYRPRIVRSPQTPST